LCQIKAAGLRHALPQAALPVDVFVDVDEDEWSLENGMLLPSGALNRTALEVQYHDELHSMLFDAPKELVAQPSAAVSFLRDALLSLIGDMVRAGSAEGSQDAHGMCQTSILDHSFAELGLDSLKFARFKAHLTAVSSVAKSLDIAVLLHTPLSELAAICNGDVSANVTKAWQLAQSERVAARLDQDSLLPTLRILETHDASSARDVLMTGATGFLGAHFLIELLRTTRGQPWKVHCLVRCIDAADGLQQLRHSRYQLKLDEVDAARIVIVCGDLSKPRFGLSERPWADLCTTIQSVIHLAERAQFSDDYSAARENVVGTLAVLQLCASSTPRKALHHASTLSILREDDRSSCCVIDETTPIGATARASGVANASGYVQSKWVCEKLVARASLDSNWQVPSFVYRLGCVSFNSNNGVDNQNGWFHKLLVGCVQALAVPPLEDGDSGSTSNLAPVDRAAKAMVDLFMLHQGARVPEGHGPNSVHHILNCAGSTPFGAFIRALEMRGLRFERMSTHADWLDAICRSGETNLFFRLKPWFERSMPGGKNDVIYQATQTMQQLATHADWNRHWNGWSPIADDAIERHLDWLTCIGVLAA
jgi:thioester reductase-like protein